MPGFVRTNFSEIENTMKEKRKAILVLPSLAIVVALLIPAKALADALPLTEVNRNNLLTDDSFESLYVLGPGDQIQVRVLGYEEFSGQYEILPDGTIILPMVGPTLVTGMTLESLNERITELFDPFLKRTNVNLNLVSRRPVIVTVIGEVSRPGPLRISGTELATLSEAIARAGGVTQYADIRRIRLERNHPDGALRTQTVNLWDVIWDEGAEELGMTSQLNSEIIMRSGDTVVIPAIPEGIDVDQRTLARSTLAPEKVNVRIIGEVRRPGEVQVSPATSIGGAIAAAGGPTPDAALQRIELIRLNQNGSVTTTNLDLNAFTNEYQVQEGDVVVVPITGFARILDTLARIFVPINSIINTTENVGDFIR